MDEAQLDPRTFWHFVGVRSLILWNARVGKGRMATTSLINTELGGGAVTLHDVDPMLGRPAEAFLEQMRTREFPAAPSRTGAIFLFDDEEIARNSAQCWLKGASFEILKVRVVQGSRIHRGSLGWLEAQPAQWVEAFRAYWRGDLSPQPPGHWEYVVDGAVYFPEWEREPFGRLLGYGPVPSTSGPY